jgi:aldehyde dehydrogenase (NAD+)
MFRSAVAKTTLSQVANGGKRLYSSLPLSVTVNLPNGKSYEQPTGLFIDNEFVYPNEKKTFQVLSPSTEEEITHVYEALDADVDAAVDAATRAFNSSWSSGDPQVRARALIRLADLVEEHAETLACIEALDNGKSLMCSRGDVALSAAYFRSCAGWADKVTGSLIETGSSHLNYVRREPIGVCGQIIPWNFPLLMATWKLAPALAAGNCVVLKPAEQTPVGILILMEIIEGILPDGVLNVVNGLEQKQESH